MKRFIPSKIRLRIKLTLRKFADRRSAFSRVKDNNNYPFTIEEEQIIRQTDFYENKIYNIKTGADCLNDVVLKKGEVFSFWNLIGNPTKKRGYKEGRNLIQGKLCSDYGGGLCQLSGIIYLTALKAGLTIKERYNHTLDIYIDEERFTPLGSDATVVYGYKDLRIENPYPFPVKFNFSVTNNSLICSLQSLERISPNKVEFLYSHSTNKVSAITFREGIEIANSVYRKN